MVFQMAIMRLCLPVSTVESLSDFLTRTELSNSVSVAAAHSHRTRKGWAKRQFAVSQMMLDLSEVYEDFYEPKDFVKFATGARDGLKMKCTSITKGRRWITKPVGTPTTLVE